LLHFQPEPAAPDQANLTNILTNLLSNPDASQIQNLAGLLSASQQNQLEDLLKQVKGAEQVSRTCLISLIVTINMSTVLSIWIGYCSYAIILF